MARYIDPQKIAALIIQSRAYIVENYYKYILNEEYGLDNSEELFSQITNIRILTKTLETAFNIDADSDDTYDLYLKLVVLIDKIDNIIIDNSLQISEETGSSFILDYVTQEQLEDILENYVLLSVFNNEIENLQDQIDDIPNIYVPITRTLTIGAGAIPQDLSSNRIFLNNVNNTSDLNKPISNATQIALNNKADLVAGKVPASQLPASVDDVLEGTYISPTVFNDPDGNPYTPQSNAIYVDTVTNKTYRWSGSNYIIIGTDLALGETSSTAYRGDRGKIAYDHSQTIGNPHQTEFDDILNTPTTLAGYGIVDGASKQVINLNESNLLTDSNGYYYLPFNYGTNVVPICVFYKDKSISGWQIDTTFTPNRLYGFPDLSTATIKLILI